MPEYVFRCQHCGKQHEKFAPIREHGTPGFKPVCCGHPTEQMIFAVHGHVRKSPYYMCPVTQKPITSWRERANVMDKHDLIDVSDMNMDRDEGTGRFKNDITGDGSGSDDPMVSTNWG